MYIKYQFTQGLPFIEPNILWNSTTGICRHSGIQSSHMFKFFFLSTFHLGYQNFDKHKKPLKMLPWQILFPPGREHEEKETLDFQRVGEEKHNVS